MARSRPVLLTAALSAAAVLGYLTYRLTAPSGAGSAPPSENAAPAAALPAATLPDFSLANLAGEPQSIKSWPGKPLLINFWATWCAPCRREIPMLKDLQAARPDLQVVGIAIDKREPVVEFADEIDFNYPILIGQSEGWAAAASMGVNIYALPFTIFASSDGSILGVHTGELHTEHLERFRSVVDDLAAGRVGLEAARNRMAEPI
jgi:thiol-disulfide isomerase/thioredoxin